MRKYVSHVELTEKIIGCAITVHKELGPGYLEKIYEHALCIELEYQNIPHKRQMPMPIFYRRKPCGFHRFDLVIEKKVLVELKAAKAFEDIHFAVVLSYLRASNLPVALLLNFAQSTLAIRRFGNSSIINGENRNTGDWENTIKLIKDERLLPRNIGVCNLNLSKKVPIS